MQIMYIVFSQAFEWKPDGQPCDSKNPEDLCTCREKFPVYMLVSGCLQVVYTRALLIFNLSRGINMTLYVCGGAVALWVILLIGACVTTMVDPGMGMGCSGACVHALLFSLSRSLSLVLSLSCAFCPSLSLLHVLSLLLSLSLMCSLSRSSALYHTRVHCLSLVHSLFLSFTLCRPSLSICKC